MSIARTRGLIVVSVLASLTSAVVSAGVMHFLAMSIGEDQVAKLNWPTGNFWYAPYTPPATDQEHTFNMGSTIEVVVPPAPAVPMPPTIEPGPSPFPIAGEPPSTGGSGNGNSAGYGSDDPSCNDSIDNDGNGLVDHADPKCFSDDGRELDTPVPVVIGIGGSHASANSNLPASCRDGIDNDGNGFADAADQEFCYDGSVGGEPGGAPNQGWPVAGVEGSVHGAAPSPVDAMDVVTDVGTTVKQAVATLGEYFGFDMNAASDSAFDGDPETPPPPAVDPIVVQQVEVKAQSNFEKVIGMAPGVIGLFGKVMPIPPALLNVANDLYVKWMNVTANCNNGRDESACGEAIMGASSAVNEFDGLIEKMLDSQPTHIQKWLENEANKL